MSGEQLGDVIADLQKQDYNDRLAETLQALAA
jgi:hypothetical protein